MLLAKKLMYGKHLLSIQLLLDVAMLTQDALSHNPPGWLSVISLIASILTKVHQLRKEDKQ